MNSSTSSFTTPAAVKRTGRGPGALPCNATTHPLPFAALPHELRKDPRLKGNRTAIVLAAALLEYARASDSCWPSNRRLAEDLGCCQQTVRNALAALQAAGWVRVEHGASNPTGRVIWLTWRAGRVIPPTPSNRLDPPLKTAGGAPLKPVGPEAKIMVVEEKEESPKFARTITTGDPSDLDTGPRVFRRPGPTPGTPGCARLPARQSERRSPNSPTWGCRGSGPRPPGAYPAAPS